MNHYAFSSAIYRLNNKHITIKESTNNFHNFTLCINKVNIATTLEDIKQTFIYRDIPIKNLKRCPKADGSSMTLITFNLVNSSDGPELFRGGISINNKKKQQEITLIVINYYLSVALAIKLVI